MCAGGVLAQMNCADLIIVTRCQYKAAVLLGWGGIMNENYVCMFVCMCECMCV